MRPAWSIIIFTVSSGLGFGLLFWLGLNIYGMSNTEYFFLFALGFTFSIAGLISSTFHLGNPQRALLAFTQWRSSWLSREAVLATVTLVVSTYYAYIVIFTNLHSQLLGYLVSCLSISTIFSTSMIYAQMKTVPRWNTFLTPILFVIYGTLVGAILTTDITILGPAFAVVGIIQGFSWKKGDLSFFKSGNINSATGIDKSGLIRLLEPPHTGENYLLKEMVFRVAQKHIFKLRLISLLFSSVAPCIICTVLWYLMHSSLTFIILLTIFYTLGIIIIRWLFFANAEHVVGRYYGK